MGKDNYEEKYTEPDLRREIKEELMSSDKGGRPGQWSARKSQLLVQEYERRGGGYKKNSKDEDAKSLEDWTDQNWQTADGSAYADDGSSMKRYLPEDAWDLLSEEEKKRAENKKTAGDADGRQFVENTIAAKAARAFVDHGDASELSQDQLRRLDRDQLYELAQTHDIEGRSAMTKKELAKELRKFFRKRLESSTKEELYDQAKQLDVDGRSQMDKDELSDAVKRARDKT